MSEPALAAEYGELGDSGQPSVHERQNPILGSHHEIPDPARGARVSHRLRCVRIAILERVRVRSSYGHQADDSGFHAGVQIHPDEGNGETNVPAVGDAVVREYGGGMRRGFERERRFDDVALERRAQTSAVGPHEKLEVRPGVFDVATILVAQIELDRAVVQILPLEGAIRRTLIVDSDAELLPAYR